MAKSKRVSKSKKKTVVYRRRNIKASKSTGNFLVRRVDAFLTVLKKEQKKCLRRKGSKNKKLLCFFRVLGDKYFWQTWIAILIIALVSFFIITGVRNDGTMSDMFNRNLQTNVILDKLREQIQKLTGRINDIEKCTKDKFWKENTEDVCNYWLYEQENDNCKKHGIATKRIAIGTKMCCNPLDTSIKFSGDGKNVVACPGSDIFFSKIGMHGSSLVGGSSYCGMGACQFYPAGGFHIKVNQDGTFAKNSDGGFIIEKDCKTSREVGPCNKDCGGGEQTAITKLKDCRTVETLELCNIQPCFTEVN